MLFDRNGENSFVVKLIKADTAISILVKPVFDKNDYTKALDAFESRHKNASKERYQKEFEKQRKLNAVNSSISNYNTKEMNRANYNMASAMNMMTNRNSFVPVAFRTFSTPRLGIINCDFPFSIAISTFSVVRQAVRKVGDASKALIFSTIFLIQKGKNTVFRFSKDEKIACDPKAKNLMWTITDKNEVAFFRISDYDKLMSGTENNILPVVAQNQEAAFEEIKKFSE